MQHMDTIPAELFPHIIGSNWELYWSLALAVPSFGRSTLTTQAKWKKAFTQVIKIVDDETWLLAGKIHRDDGPAVIKNRDQFWYQYGLQHRDGDLPSTIYAHADGTFSKIWAQRGKCCRGNDLPAYEHITPTGAVDRVWYQDDKQHRDGGKPAFIIRGMTKWLVHGNLHRDGDEPAVVSPTLQEWYKHGKLHRDGRKPARICLNEEDQYWVNGIRRWYPV